MELPKLVVMNLKKEFIQKINQSKKVRLSERIILVGEDTDFLYFIDLLSNTFLMNQLKDSVVKLDNEIHLINKHIDLEWIYRIRPEVLAENLECYPNSNQFVYQTLNYDNQIAILRNLIKNIDEKSKQLPKVVNIIKTHNNHKALSSEQ